MPMLTATGTVQTPPSDKGVVSLNAEQEAACKALGIDQAQYLKTLEAETKERS